MLWMREGNVMQCNTTHCMNMEMMMSYCHYNHIYHDDTDHEQHDDEHDNEDEDEHHDNENNDDEHNDDDIDE